MSDSSCNLEMRRAFYRALVQGKEDARQMVPERLAMRWERKLLRDVEPTLAAQPRLINHFKVGADPEYMFTYAGGTYYDDYGERRTKPEQAYHAENLNMKTGMAVGADQNGRLVEVRPKADEFVLRVLGSLCEELRWCGTMFPKTLTLNWRCNPFMFNDGLGGHVHFGRKRPTRPQEVNALDGLARFFLELELFPKEEWLRRREGDQFHQRYGLPGDYRPQIHGYEYRTLPSWLDNPWLAYFVMVTSKLAVVDPELTTPWNDVAIKPSVALIERLLAYFKGVDDDARICLMALRKLGLPKFNANDFKNRWGVPKQAVTTKVTVLPTAIAPTEQTVKELFDYLVNGKEITSRVPEPTWAPTTMPNGFYALLDGVNTHGKVGIGELLWDVVAKENLPVEVKGADNEDDFFVGGGLAAKLKPGWRGVLTKMYPDLRIRVGGTGTVIALGKNWRTVKKLAICRKLLLSSGVFPLWRLRDTANAAWDEPEIAQIAVPERGVLYPAQG